MVTDLLEAWLRYEKRSGVPKGLQESWRESRKRRADQGLGDGNENLTVDDLLTVDLTVRDVGACKLVFKNREHLHVVDTHGAERRVKVGDVVAGDVPKEDYWPLSMEEALAARFPRLVLIERLVARDASLTRGEHARVVSEVRE